MNIYMALINPIEMRNLHTFIDYVVKNKGHIPMKSLIIELRKETQYYEYFNTLEKWEILKSKRFKNRKFLKINSRLP